MSRSIADLLAEAPAVRACRDALGDAAGVWIVGGAVRDAALGRTVTDLDLAVSGDPREVAAAIARGGGKMFQLSEEFATWRAIGPDDAWQVDVARPSRRGDRGRPGASRLHRQRDGGSALARRRRAARSSRRAHRPPRSAPCGRSPSESFGDDPHSHPSRCPDRRRSRTRDRSRHGRARPRARGRSRAARRRAPARRAADAAHRRRPDQGPRPPGRARGDRAPCCPSSRPFAASSRTPTTTSTSTGTPSRCSRG